MNIWNFCSERVNPSSFAGNTNKIMKKSIFRRLHYFASAFGWLFVRFVHFDKTKQNNINSSMLLGRPPTSPRGFSVVFINSLQSMMAKAFRIYLPDKLLPSAVLMHKCVWVSCIVICMCNGRHKGATRRFGVGFTVLNYNYYEYIFIERN